MSKSYKKEKISSIDPLFESSKSAHEQTLALLNRAMDEERPLSANARETSLINVDKGLNDGAARFGLIALSAQILRDTLLRRAYKVLESKEIKNREGISVDRLKYPSDFIFGL